MTTQERTERRQAERQVAIYNANLTNHLFTRMQWNPDKPQYKRDYENRAKHFKGVA